MEEVDEKTQALVALRLSADISKVIREEVQSMMREYDFGRVLVQESPFVFTLTDTLFGNYGFQRKLQDAILVEISRDKANSNAVQRQI